MNGLLFISDKYHSLITYILLYCYLKFKRDKPTNKLSKSIYESELAKLHVELVQLHEWVKAKGLKILVIFEGRDASGKGGVIHSWFVLARNNYRNIGNW